jgi:N4-gp56 family major capsid protein
MATSTTSLTQTMQLYYDRVFLTRAMMELRYDFGAQIRPIPMNSGKSIVWTRFSPLAVVTSALSEATNPSDVAMTGTQVSATLAEYGAFTTVSSLYSMTSIETGLKEHIEVHGQNAGESIDTLIRNVLALNGATSVTGPVSQSGTTIAGVQWPATVTAASTFSTVHTTDTLTGLEIRRAVRTLKVNKAQKFDNGLYRGIISAEVAMDLMGNSEWLDAHRYTTSDAIERGVIGKLHGVEFVETNNGFYYSSGGYSTSATNVSNIYFSFIFGKNAYGIVNLASISAPKVYVKNPSGNSTDNPLDLFSTVGWKMPFACKTLNTAWIVPIVTGATDQYHAG